jgi:DNA-binding MarR family transcriptional regulator
MHTESSDPRAAEARRLERAVVLVLLSEDDGRRTWSRSELREGMGVGDAELTQALDALIEAGVLQQEQDRLSPSPATRRLDGLELIGI